MTLFNDRIRDIDVEISELNQQIKKLELEQKKMKERNAEVDKALKILGQVVEDYRSDDEVIFDLKHALSAMFLTPEELERIANSQGSEFHPDAIAKNERNGYQPETVEVGASEVEPEADSIMRTSAPLKVRLKHSGSITNNAKKSSPTSNNQLRGYSGPFFVA